MVVCLDDCMQCCVRLQRCQVDPDVEDELMRGDDDVYSVNSPTILTGPIQERHEELDQAPSWSVRLSEHLAYLYETPTKVECDLGDFANFHTYDPLYDISPLRGIRFSPWKPSPVRPVMEEEEEEEKENTDL